MHSSTLAAAAGNGFKMTAKCVSGVQVTFVFTLLVAAILMTTSCAHDNAGPRSQSSAEAGGQKIKTDNDDSRPKSQTNSNSKLLQIVAPPMNRESDTTTSPWAVNVEAVTHNGTTVFNATEQLLLQTKTIGSHSNVTNNNNNDNDTNDGTTKAPHYNALNIDPKLSVRVNESDLERHVNETAQYEEQGVFGDVISHVADDPLRQPLTTTGQDKDPTRTAKPRQRRYTDDDFGTTRRLNTQNTAQIIENNSSSKSPLANSKTVNCQGQGQGNDASECSLSVDDYPHAQPTIVNNNNNNSVEEQQLQHDQTTATATDSVEIPTNASDSLRLELIQQQILRQLGMEHAPEVMENAPIPASLLEEYEDVFEEPNTEEVGVDPVHSKIIFIMGTTHPHCPPSPRPSRGQGHDSQPSVLCFVFALNVARLRQEPLVSARMRIFKKPSRRKVTPGSNATILDLYVTELLDHPLATGSRSPGISKGAADRHLMAKYKVNHTESFRWLNFDITNTLNYWLKDQRQGQGQGQGQGYGNYSTNDSIATSKDRDDNATAPVQLEYHVVRIECRTCSGSLGRLLGYSANDSAVITVTIGGQGHGRTRRQIDECTAQSARCCRVKFYVRFSDIGWSNWIISPKGYYANYCAGKCSGFSATRHGSVLQQYNQAATDVRQLLKPCCAPDKFDPLSLLFFDNDGFIVRQDLTKMRVASCGCA